MRIILACALLLLSIFVRSEPVLIATGEFAPYCSEESKHQGFVSHVVREAFARQGHQVQFDFMPWKRAYEASKAGHYAASSWWAHSEDRAKEFNYSDEVVDSRLHIFYVKNKWPKFDWNSVRDLTGYTLGMTRSYFTTDEIEAAVDAGRINVVKVNDDAQNFRLLLSGRADLIPMNLVAGLELLRKEFSSKLREQIAYHSKPVSSRPGYLIFPKNSEHSQKLMSIFNAGLASLKADGSYDKMYQALLSGEY